MKKTIYILVILALLLASCSSLSSFPTQEPIILRFGVLDDPEVFEALAVEYQREHPNITIELVRPPALGNNFDQLIEQFSKADVVRMSSYFLNNEQAQFLRPMDEFVSLDAGFNREDFFPGSLEALQIEGAQYGIPAGLSPLVMYYDDLRLKIAKSEPPGLDYTLDEFLVYANEVNNQDSELVDETLFSYGFCTYPRKEDILFLTYLFGGGLFDRFPGPSQPTFDLPENVAALRWYASLYQDYQIVPPVSDEQYRMYGLIRNVQCGYWLGWLEQFGFMDDAASSQHALPLPGGDSKVGFSTLDGYFMTQASQHPAEAYDFISFLVNRMDAANGTIPPLRSQVESQDFEKKSSPEILAIARRMPGENIFLGLDDTQDEKINQAIELFYQAVEEVVLGAADPAIALDQAQVEAEVLFMNP